MYPFRKVNMEGIVLAKVNSLLKGQNPQTN